MKDTGAGRDKAAGKVVERLTSQKQTLEMARFFDPRKTTRVDTILGVVSAVIIYGVGAGFVLYLLFLATT